MEQSLSVSERTTILEHLDHCPDCRRWVGAMVRLRSSQHGRGDGGIDISPPEAALAEFERAAKVGRYLLLERLGVGGMGVVYAAYDPQLNRQVAVKLLKSGPTDPIGQARLTREAQALARLAHPNVVAVYDVGPYDNGIFVAMELVEGETLGRYLAKRLHTWREVRDLFVQAGKGLAASHAASIVHRDFKPSNVMVGKDGRVRVTDFGLARVGQPALGEGSTSFTPPSAPPPMPSAAAPVFESASEVTPTPSMPTLVPTPTPTTPTPTPTRTPALMQPAPSRMVTPDEFGLTVTGALIGTPAYMAPEQRRSGDASAHSDQYSFCVAFYEALYHQRPDSTSSAARASSSVPAWLRRIVLRGLEADPKARWPSMEVLVRALEADPTSRRLRWALSLVALVVAVVGSWTVLRASRVPPPCLGAEAALRGAWDSERREAVRKAFEATGKSYASDAWREVSEQLDTQAAAWTQMRTQACESTRIRREQSEAVLDLRMGCLDQRLDEMRALVSRFTQADGPVVERSIQAVSALTPLRSCADVAHLLSVTPPPPGPEARAVLDEIDHGLAQARASLNTGKFDQGLAQVAVLLPKAQALHYAPAEAKVLDLKGELQGWTDSKAAIDTLRDAAWSAEEGHDDELAARVRVIRFDLAARSLGPGTSLTEIKGEAQAALKRLGGNALLESDMENVVASIALQAQDFPAAKKGFERVVQLRSQLNGEDSLGVAQATGGLAVVYRGLGDLERAREMMEKTLQLQLKVLGPNHPQVGLDYDNLALIVMAQGRYDEALELNAKARKILEAALGNDDPEVALCLGNTALIDEHKGDFAAALPLLQRALVITAKRWGPERFDVAQIHSDLAEVFNQLDRAPEALVEAKTAQAALVKLMGPDNPNLISPLTAEGEALINLGKADEAMESLEHALKLSTANPGDPGDLASVRFLVARAERARHGDLVRARTLAQAAREEFLALGERGAKEVAELDHFLGELGEKPGASKP